MKIIAHRGYSSRYPENSLIAIQEAVKLPIDMVEVDVHLSKDNKIVVNHDYDLKKFSGLQGLIREHFWADLSQVDIGSWKDQKFSDQKLVLLEDVLDTVTPKTVLLIEVKGNMGIYPEMPELIKGCIEKQGAQHHVIIQAFNTDILESMNAIMGDEIEMHKLIEGFSREHYFDDTWKKGRIQTFSNYSSLNPNIDHAHIESSNYLKSQFKNMFFWTVNSPDKMRLAKEFGADGIITDFPDVALELFK